MAKLGPEDETVDLHFLTKQSIANGEEMCGDPVQSNLQGMLSLQQRDLFNTWEKHCPLILKHQEQEVISEAQSLVLFEICLEQ